jgi:proteasome lid subunit RPN8/RPN11
MLIGRSGEVVAAEPAGNLAEEPGRFLIDPKDHFAALRRARAQGLDVVGFYHSHPWSSSAPSSRDLEEASYRRHLYLIVGLGLEWPDFGFYWLDDAGFVPAAFSCVP